MATERIQIIVTQSGAVTVKKDIQDIGTASKNSATSVDTLKSAIGAFITLQAAQKLGELADAGTRLTNSLTIAGLSGQGLIAEQEKLFDLATKNGQNVNELAGIFQKLTAVQGQLGASGADVDKVLTGIAASMKLSTAGSAAQAGSLQQLSQLFGGVKVQAQEYNSLVDGAYPLLQAAAAGSERWGGSVAKLTQDVKNSSVTTKEFFDALRKGSDVNIQLAESFNLTLGQAMTNFNTQLVRMVLYLNQSTGAFNLVANTINFAAQNLGVLLAILSPLIAGLTVLAIQIIGGYLVTALTAANLAVTGLIGSLAKLFILIATNPLLLLGVAIAGILAYFVDWENAVKNLIRLWGGLVYAIGQALTALGIANDLTENGRSIVINADKAAEAIKGAAADAAVKLQGGMNSGADAAAPKLRKAISDGAGDAATRLKEVQDRLISNYEAMNGRSALLLEGSLINGGKYFYNAANGSITAASNTGGETIKQKMIQGGNTAADAIGAAMSAAGRSAANEVKIAANQAIQASKGLAGSSVDLGLGFSPGTFLDNGRRPTLYGGDGSYTTSGRYANSSPMIDPVYNNNNSSGNNQKSFTSDNGVSPAASPNVTIVNNIDPSTSLSAIDTAQGNQAIINVIKTNAPELQRILGVN